MLKDLRPALRSFLMGDPLIAAAIGPRIFPIQIPNPFPAGMPVGTSLVYNIISEQTDMHMQGPSGLVVARYQLDVWAASMDESQRVALLVKERMSGFRGVWGDLEVQGVFPDLARTAYDTDTKQNNSGRDYMIKYIER